MSAGRRRFRCRSCGFRCSASKRLLAHIFDRHQGTPPPTFVVYGRMEKPP